jgi:hypothetical protein
MEPEFLRLKVPYNNKPARWIIKRDESTKHLVDEGIAGATVLAGVVRFLQEWSDGNNKYQPGDYGKIDDEKILADLKAKGIAEDPTR